MTTPPTPPAFPVTLGMGVCTRGCRQVTYGQVCTDTPGAVHPTGDRITICPPRALCDDAVVHRADGTDWHTAKGTSAHAWYFVRGLPQGALDLDEPTP